MRRLLCLVLTAIALSTGAGAQTLEKMEHSEALVGLRNLMIPPIARSETTNLIDAGLIETEGFSHMTLNLAAELKGPAPQKGVIGVLLIPDVEPFRHVYRVLGLVPATVDFTVGAAPSSGSYLMAGQQTFEVGFPRYRALLYNTTGTSATVAFFAYRTRR